MKLTAEEVEEGARRLCETSGTGRWTEQSDNQKTGFRMVVTGLAGELPEPSPAGRAAALFVFMTWMGDP